MRDHRLDTLIVAVGRCLRFRQHVFRVEDIQALVFHRAHVEVGNGGDIENVQVVFQTEDILVPTHGGFERAHRVRAFIFVAAADINAKIDRTRPDFVVKLSLTETRSCPRPGRISSSKVLDADRSR